MAVREVTDEIKARIIAFKECVLSHGVERALSDHILKHDCSIVGRDFERRLRGAVAEHFGADVELVYIVGSAKLGFSPKPGQYFKPFSDQSDVDIAIVCPDLFSRIWHEVSEMERAHEYFDFEKFKHYLFMGWIRPDKMPSKSYETCREWWDFFRRLSGSEEFMRLKISAGLYYDRKFLRRYQLVSLVSLRENIEGRPG
ncbi:hypothetical protein J7I44_01695 [Frateuria sp. MAH-13]|uniref:Polymerase nucleotidyl transferase domain-containing protein n=1 Tax=Frateuria flava TaxID=2821489 RepID=A0ABS4DIW7_9GAMM|nr:hypothetical protein [Frateuria flava]MBP1472993.1 hypothetical protein [Frateuria flava]